MTYFEQLMQRKDELETDIFYARMCDTLTHEQMNHLYDMNIELINIEDELDKIKGDMI